MWSLMMSFWQPVSNLKEYVTHNPPGATFFLCLLTLGISFIYLSSYSYTYTLPNPDITKDWNVALSSLSQFHLCEKANASSFVQVSSTPPLLKEQEKDHTPSVNSPSSITVLNLRVPLTVTASLQSSLLKDVSLVTTLTASQLHLGDKELVNLTLQIQPNSNYTCLTISVSTNLLPLTPLPPVCPASQENISFIPVEVNKRLQTPSQACYSLHFRNDPTLTVMLTLEEKSVAVRHLLEVSLSLICVCFLLCLAASLTGSNPHHNYQSGLGLQSEPLIDG